MSEEQEVPPVEQVVEQKTEQKPEPKGTDYIDFNAIPEEIREPIEARFKRLYGHVKEGERSLEAMRQHNEELARAVEELRNARVQDETEKSLSDLRAQKVQALETGDYQRAALLDEQIFTRVNQKPEQKPEQKPQPAPISGEDMEVVTGWAREADESGRPKRPWTTPGHPLHQRMELEAAAVLADPNFSMLPTAEILKEVDRRMGISTPRPPVAGVLPAGGARPPRGDKPLSEDEKFVARKFWPHLKPEDAFKKYSAQRKILKGA